MITMKQVDAFYWASTLGSFEAAAQKLNTVQSTISKRIQDFEYQSKVTLFDRTKRKLRLTMKGEEMLRHVEELIARRDTLVLAMKNPEEYYGKFCFGVTELIALTFLPKMISIIKQKYPRLNLVFTVDTAASLYGQLREHRIDLVLATPHSGPSDFERVPLAELELAWMASPLLLGNEKISIHYASEYPLIMQVSNSGLRAMLERWLRENDAHPNNLIACNSMKAIGELAIAGLGIACVPRHYFQPKVMAGILREIEVDPVLPTLSYFATYRSASIELAAEIAVLAAEVCDFRHPRAMLDSTRPVSFDAA